VLLWVLVLSLPAFYAGSVVPCFACHDFTAVMMHEVGHVLGLGHSDSPYQMCGCGPNAAACKGKEEEEETGRGIMHSISLRRRSMCLTRDDVDALRTYHGGACDDPIWCYESASYSGYIRIATTFLYSFLLSCSIVFVRNRVEGRRRETKKSTVISVKKDPPRPRKVMTRPPPFSPPHRRI